MTGQARCSDSRYTLCRQLNHQMGQPSFAVRNLGTGSLWWLAKRINPKTLTIVTIASWLMMLILAVQRLHFSMHSLLTTSLVHWYDNSKSCFNLVLASRLRSKLEICCYILQINIT
jgi:hypothetical protein